ncbi:TonB family protein [Nannocystaceae bacterium ST9]
MKRLRTSSLRLGLGLALLAPAMLAPRPGIAAPPSEGPQLTRAPELIEFVEAEYPAAELEAGVGASVLLRLTLTAEGSVSAVEVVESAGEGFDAAASAAALQFRFSPAEVDGVASSIRILYRYEFTPPPPPPAAALVGTLRSSDDGEALAGVELRITGEQLPAPIVLTTDDAGGFRLDEVPAGPIHVTIVRPGLDPVETDETLVAGEELSVAYEIGEPESVAVETGDDIEIVVVAPPLRREAATTKVDAREAARVPGSSGDVVRVVESLPGVGRSTAGSGQLVVWGASPRYTRIYVDGVPIPRLYHEGGLRSVVHPLLVSSLELSPGGHGAAWGRGLGGLVRIETATPQGERTSGRVAADLLDASTVVSVPIGERVHLAAAARFGYVKYWTDALLPDVGTLVPIPVYGDGQLRLAWRPSTRDSVEFVGLTSHDRFVRRVGASDPALAITDSRALDFQRLYAKWTRDGGDGHLLTVTPFVGFGRERQAASFGELKTRLGTDTWMGGVRVASNHRVRPWLRVEVGLDAEIEHAAIDRRGALALPAREGDVRVFGQPPPESIAGDDWTVTQVGLAPYVEAEFSIAQGAVRIIPGLRIDPQVRSVSRRNPPAANTPAVGLFNQDLAVEPRLALLAQPIERLSLRAAVGLYRQNPAPEDLSAAFGNPNLPNARALHVVGGGAVSLTKTLSLDLTGFFTRAWDLGMRSADAAPLPAELLVASGRGRSYGLQVMLRQGEWKGLFGWVAYTFMRAERRDREAAPWRLSDYDQTHVLTVVGGWALPLGFELGGRFRLASGFPRTPVVDAWFDATRNLYQPVFGAHNGDRLPVFVQLDLRLGKRFEFETSKLELFVEVLNVWNQRNAEEYVYSSDYRQRGRLSGFPVFPSLGVQWDF